MNNSPHLPNSMEGRTRKVTEEILYKYTKSLEKGRRESLGVKLQTN